MKFPFRLCYIIRGIRQYDETPIWLKVDDAANTKTKKNEDGDLGHIDKKARFSTAGSVKLLVTEHRWAAMLRFTGFSCKGNGKGGKGFQGASCAVIESQMAAPLQTISSNSGKILAAAVNQTVSQEWDLDVNRSFAKLLDIVTTDDFAGNHLAERVLTQQNQSQYPDQRIGKLHVTCDVHKIHACSRAVVDMLPLFGSGLVKSSLALRSGQMSRFRESFRKVVRQNLKIYHGTVPDFGGPEPTAYRNFMLDTFWSTTSGSDRAVVERLFNGNWTLESEIQHFCYGHGCCASKEDTVQAIETFVLKALAREGPRIFQKAKWIGGHDA